MKTRRSRRSLRALAIAMLAVYCIGCWGEDRLAGTPTNLPPGTMPPAPPLSQSPADMAKAAKGKMKARKARH